MCLSNFPSRSKKYPNRFLLRESAHEHLARFDRLIPFWVSADVTLQRYLACPRLSSAWQWENSPFICSRRKSFHKHRSKTNNMKSTPHNSFHKYIPTQTGRLRPRHSPSRHVTMFVLSAPNLRKLSLLQLQEQSLRWPTDSPSAQFNVAPNVLELCFLRSACLQELNAAVSLGASKLLK